MAVPGTRWTAEEESLLRSLYPEAAWEVLLDSLPGRTQESIRSHAYHMKVKRDHDVLHGSWADWEIEYLKEHYYDTARKQILDNLPDRTWSAVITRAQLLGLHRYIYPQFVGKEFGRLVVLEDMGQQEDGGDRRRIWKCQCACGKITYARTWQLTSGNKVSCGCAQKLDYGIACFNQLLRAYRDGAKGRGYDWDLTEAQFHELVTSPCYYCGAYPSNTYKKSDHFGEFVYNGIDRIDNDKGYVVGNCVSCCKHCNYAKSQMTEYEFYAWAKRLADKLKATGRFDGV